VNLRVAGAFLGRSLIWPLQLPGWRPRTQESLACQRQGGQRRTNISFARSGSGALVSAGFSTLASLVCPARNLFFSPAFLPLIDPGSTVPPSRRDPPVGSSPWGCVLGGRPHGSVGRRKMGKMDESPSSRSGQRVSAGEEPEGVGAELGRVEEETEEEDQRDGEQHQCNSPKCFDPLLKAL
jgi:hypothetical protein